jgi:predicted transcriptional regulator
VALPKFTKPELQVMDALWDYGASSVREIQERLHGRCESIHVALGR